MRLTCQTGAALNVGEWRDSSVGQHEGNLVRCHGDGTRYHVAQATGTPFFSGTAVERPVRDVGEAAGGVGNGSDVTFTQSDFTQQIAHGLCRLAGVGPMQAEA